MVVPFDNQEAYHGTNGFNDIKFDSLPDTSRVSSESAVDAIRRIVAAHPGELSSIDIIKISRYFYIFFSFFFLFCPGEVTMLCLAPLTNLALALKVDPSLSSHLKEVVLMGGNIEGMGNTAMSVAAEFNFLADPEAAFVVLNCASPCPVTIISWELCFKYFNIPMEWRKKKLGVTETTQAELFNRLEQPWFDNYDFDPEVWMLCDQVAMAVVLNPGLVKESRRKRATVELAGHLSRGNMLLEWRPYIERTEDFKPNVVVINRVDEEAFMQDLLRAFQFKF